MTNVESRYLAFQVAVHTDDSQLRSKVVEALSNTERNFILQKDQTTVELEKEKITSAKYLNIADALHELLKKKD